MVAPEEQAAYDEKRKKFEVYGLVHGAYEGEELQLPGYFLLDREMNVAGSPSCQDHDGHAHH